MKWEKVEIGQLGEVITGNTPPRKNPELYGDFIPFIKPTDMEIDRRYTPNPEECYSELGFEKYRKSLIPKGATCVVTIGSIGKKMTQALTDCFINQAVNAVIPNKNYDQDFVYYLLKNNLDKVKGSDSGTSSGRENVSKSSFSSIEVKVIKHLPTQRKIASILSAYDDLIENNLKRIKLLEEKAFLRYKAIVKSEKIMLEEKLMNVIQTVKRKEKILIDR
ncbi:restriction endonuclease subunit S [Runella slithyformis]|uniref:Restriction modification system DNA specificity domain protein n=1 Tax=Runella slithyformis (strain ATCC 29530 / DSM 19594 / LMG 11500 / NCIMB 11436 / LSU 4) TaxID=761193 RepID=A0A7U3ZMC5_RUNSL|nr:restriction endonuclease subunit S [Runella slithyformis]AEI49866.1 restriction modification system DNA specificity domain protein [Runella slithyformis DSM 19594]